MQSHQETLGSGLSEWNEQNEMVRHYEELGYNGLRMVLTRVDAFGGFGDGG